MAWDYSRMGGGETGMQADSEEPDSPSSSGSAVNKEQAAVGATLANVPLSTATLPNDSGLFGAGCVSFSTTQPNHPPTHPRLGSLAS